MRTGILWGVIVILLGIIALLMVILFSPGPVQAPTNATSTAPTASSSPSTPSTSTTSTSSATSTAPLHDRVVVTSPSAGATVGQSFTVNGEAPGNWYFEAVFPIKVADKDGNPIAATQAQAQSDWMTTAQVPFTAQVTLDIPYTGPATLSLLRDNPSGLPQNDDSLTIPIVIQ